MGKLLYGAKFEMLIEDRPLAHLQLVIASKIKRGERFFLSWVDAKEEGGGRTVLWIEPSISLVFRYSKPNMPSINREWLAELTESANSAQGLRLLEEPAAPR
jgi:hypothetical protein